MIEPTVDAKECFTCHEVLPLSASLISSFLSRDTGRRVMPAKDLYFLLNPYTGLIKIGVADDIAARQCALEMACGVRLRLLASSRAGEQAEKVLHEIFYATRAVGEWFIPSDDLLAIIDDPTTIGEFIKRAMPAVERRRVELEAAEAEIRQRKEVERQARLQAKKEAERKKREEERRKAEAKARRDQLRREREEREIEERRDAWIAHKKDVIAARGLIANDAATARERTDDIMKRQRERNARLLGKRALNG